MPRVATKRIETIDLQGEGSYLIIKSVDWATAKKINGFLSIGNVKERADMTPEQKKKHLEAETELTERCLFTSIVFWNWADEDNNPLPVPRKTEDLDRLTNEEVQFLIEAVTGRNKPKENDLKNSESGSSTTSGLEEKTTLPQTSG